MSPAWWQRENKKKELIFNFFGYETNDPIHILGWMGVGSKWNGFSEFLALPPLEPWGTGWEGCSELGEMFL